MWFNVTIFSLFFRVPGVSIVSEDPDLPKLDPQRVPGNKTEMCGWT